MLPAKPTTRCVIIGLAGEQAGGAGGKVNAPAVLRMTSLKTTVPLTALRLVVPASGAGSDHRQLDLAVVSGGQGSVGGCGPAP